MGESQLQELRHWVEELAQLGRFRGRAGKTYTDLFLPQKAL